MALTLANVQTSDTFQTWFTRTNEIIRDSFPATGGTVSGNVTANFITVGNISGNVSANFITGDGSGITGVGITTALDAVANRNLDCCLRVLLQVLQHQLMLILPLPLTHQLVH